MNDSEKRKKVDIGTVVVFNAEFHCCFCCQIVAKRSSMCDCELERIPMYVEYERGAKEYAYECLTCKSINKIS